MSAQRGLGRSRSAILLSAVAASALLAGAGYAQSNTSDIITVTARRVSEDVQSVPIPVSVVGGGLVSDSGIGNVAKLEELVPTLQIYTSNPRNTALNIRGLGTTFGLTNDGVEIGVGLYVDDVFWARPAQATLDFIDIEQIEVLRGPQGTLYGKNTTAGAIKITTRRPTFDPETDAEVSFGDYGFLSAKATISGPIWGDTVAGRISFSGTQRDGFLKQLNPGQGEFSNFSDDLNDANNLGLRGSLLFDLGENLEIIVAGDYTHQRPEGYAQVPVRVAPTYRTPNRQFFGIIDSINSTAAFNANLSTPYGLPTPELFRETLPVTTTPIIVGGNAVNLQSAPAGIHAEFDAFARVTDADVPHRSYQDIDGQSVTINWDVGPGTLTSVSALRHWEWYPSNDRDFIGLPIVTQSANRSKQDQTTQEIRYAGDLFDDRLGFVLGAFYFTQEIETHNTQSHGWAASRWLLDPRASASFTGSYNGVSGTATGAQVAFIPGLADGLTQTQNVYTETTSAALFGQLEWSVTDRFRILPGIRLNYDEKSTDYDSPVTGGIDPTSVPGVSPGGIVGAQNSIVSRQTYTADLDDTNVSGQVTLAYDLFDDINLYATYATSFKSFGLNTAGVPANTPVTVEPEEVTHYEAGIKTRPFEGATFNLTAFNTDIDDYQTQVVANVVGTLRGYLANAEKVRVRGAEIDSSWQATDSFSLRVSLAYTDGEYVSFPNSPLPIEETGRPIPNPNFNPSLPVSSSNALTITAPFKDISGARLPGISEWAATVGGEYVIPSSFLGRDGEYFAAVDASYRSDFSSDAAASEYLLVDGYSLLNARFGFRANENWDVYVWGRNVLDEEYYEILATQSGGSGLVVGSLGDPRTIGVTLRGSF